MPSILSLLSPRGLLEGGSSSRSRSPWDQLAAAAAAADFYQLKQHSSSSSQPTWPRQAAAPTNDGKPGSLGISPLGAQIIITQVVMSILAVAWTGMRVWARRNRRISPFVVEDVLCYVALVGSHLHNLSSKKEIPCLELVQRAKSMGADHDFTSR